MKYQTILSTVLMIPFLTSARMVPRASSSDTMQLNCTTGLQAIDCSMFYGTSCSSSGVVQNRNSSDMPINGDCTAKHCTCEMTPPPFCFTETGSRVHYSGEVVCGPYAYGVPTLFDGTGTSSTGNAAVATPTSSMPTVPSGSECATVTMTVTVTQHHRAGNGSLPYPHSWSFSRHQNATATHHHHKSGLTETKSASFFSLTVAPRTTISSIPLIYLTGNPSPPPSASNLGGEPTFLPPSFSAAGSPVGASASSSSAPYN